MRAALYCRISDDRRGLGLGVQRQHEDCLELVQRRGWQAVATFTDNDVSAYSGKPRPGYRELLAAIEDGLIDVVVAWHPDRLHRSPIELEEFITTIERGKVMVQTVQAGEWDLSTASGQLVARQLGAVARYESQHKRDRVQRAMKQRAEKGKSHGRRAFGWRRVYEPDGTSREVLDPVEADVIRTAAKRVLVGDSLRSIAAGLNANGPEPPGGPEWTASAVRSILLRDRNVGNLIRHGEIVGTGDWEPVLEVAIFDQVRAVLRDPARRTATGTAAKYLLSGLGKCGQCGGRMRSSTAGGKAQYACEKKCLARNRDRVDELVTKVLVERLSRPDVAEVFAGGRRDELRGAVDEVAELRARLDLAADDYADGKIDRLQLERITARLRPKIEAAEKALRRVDNAPVLAGLAGRADVAESWPTLPLARQRAILDLLMTVTIHRTRQGAGFDPTSVAIEWRSP